jgi:hypothetical protein
VGDGVAGAEENDDSLGAGDTEFWHPFIIKNVIIKTKTILIRFIFLYPSLSGLMIYL